MNNFHSSVVTAMVMVILPKTERKNQKKILKKKRLISGLKFKKLVFLARTIEGKVKKETLGMEPIVMGRASLKLKW